MKKKLSHSFIKDAPSNVRNKKTSYSRLLSKRKPGKDVPSKHDLLPNPFPIVGFGASAGGIKAFTAVLKHLRPDLGMAYVFIMHLSPNHKSALREIMQSKTIMPVQTVKDGMEVKANNVYVIPPNTFMSVVDGHLKLAPRSLTSIGNFAIDYFLNALAAVYKNNAIGVILSGTATDGTLGLKAIKAFGGITFAQDESAEFFGMPQNAFACGYVDIMRSPEGIADELSKLVKIPYTILPYDKIEAVQIKELNAYEDELKAILSLVKSKKGIDFFSQYKRASVYRRVIRRMSLNKLQKLSEYTSLLKANPKEVDALYKDFLINVTSFFRDPDFFSILTKEVFPNVIKRTKTAEPFRIWVAGCATGEEAYSIAISLVEYLEKEKLSIAIQIFASDLDAEAVEKARPGIYPFSALQGISADYRKKYFIKTENHYQIIKAVRELIVFSQHNLLKDPPFSRMDLISCQNVLIYLEAEPQKRILQVIHYALKPTGYLFLGKSESIGSLSELFEPTDKKIKLFSRKVAQTSRLDLLPYAFRTNKGTENQRTEENTDGDKGMNKVMLSQYVFPGVVLNQNMVITQFYGDTSAYITSSPGKASLNILKMIRQDLLIDVRSLLQTARQTERVTIAENILVYNNKKPEQVTIEVVPKKIGGNQFFLMVFKENETLPSSPETEESKKGTVSMERIIGKLEDELTQSRDIIRTTNEEYESTYEELQANNEEILSSNEELQSVNEELETSKEELQSANEELTMTNDELQKRNLELKESQSYAQAIIETMHNPLLVLTANLQVRMGNDAFYETFRLVHEEVEGRFIYDLGNHSWEIPALREHLNDLLVNKKNFRNFEITHLFQGLGELVLEINSYRLIKGVHATETLILLDFNNISELSKSNKALVKANGMLEEFAFISSHDLQEPLRKIQTFSDMLFNSNAHLNEYARAYANKIHSSAARMSSLLKDLLQFSILVKNGDIKLIKINLNDILKNILVDFELVIQREKVVMNISPLPEIYGASAQINQLFHNLIGNAIKFSKQNPIISVSSRETTSDDFSSYPALKPDIQYVCILIKDQGIGFDQEYAEKIFVLFQRLDDRKGVPGTGMGLAICKKIVEDHHGFIYAEGKRNEGATFTIFFPMYDYFSENGVAFPFH
jgi:two-component system CheB/CheR fusion protein